MAMHLLLWLGVFGICVSGETQGDIRLVGNENRGRLEIYYNSTWGTVCDDLFNDVDATVVCRQLDNGFIHGTSYKYGGGSGQIWLDNVGCNGTESQLQDCDHKGWGTHNCAHCEDVGVECFVRNDGDIRLAGGGCEDIGRLEIYYNSTWGTVCNDEFTDVDATVVCRQLNKRFSFGTVPITNVPGSGPIWIDNLGCNGTESRIQDCYHKGWGNHNCGHIEDVWVACFGLSEGIE